MLKMTDRNIRATAWAGFFLLSTALLASACDDSGSVTAPRAPAATLVGTVTRSDTGEPIANAEVSVGAEQVTTGPDGRFELAHLAAGPAVLWCTKLGFVDFKHPITLGAGRNDLAITLTYRTEVFEFGDFALYVPAEVDEPRGILVALGGPDTRGFASSAPFGAPLPEVEAALQALGQDFRTMALEQGIAILGTSQASMTNSASSVSPSLWRIR